ncbi:hypothetical protein FEM48_Zijuj07G0068900 [Ziziphus jujuba var. spinosa]|uniref:Uncharacterized protein n=1 Tax=Ziziphus jujuba var. spinosa TaxID=714518 RepID=A0A978V350_ZIZJJ|nr:hypothetical protein FEM48_Zijuj07G0068900 [Ziziphus jujuba var. spinosa]
MVEVASPLAKRVTIFWNNNGSHKNVFDLGTFVGDLNVEEDSNSDDLISLHDQIRDCETLLSGFQVNDEYMRTLETLRKKLKFVEVDKL